MDTLLLLIGRLSGVAGALLAVFAVILRATGRYSVGNYDAGTLFIGGMATMMFACLCLLIVLTNRLAAKP